MPGISEEPQEMPGKWTVRELLESARDALRNAGVVTRQMVANRIEDALGESFMSDMNETARSTLRRAVLEARADLRRAHADVKQAESNLEKAQMVFRVHRNRIVELQEAAGDPIEIDPSYPEIK